jgi:hypothetical protein
VKQRSNIAIERGALLTRRKTSRTLAFLPGAGNEMYFRIFVPSFCQISILTYLQESAHWIADWSFATSSFLSSSFCLYRQFRQRKDDWCKFVSLNSKKQDVPEFISFLDSNDLIFRKFV